MTANLPAMTNPGTLTSAPLSEKVQALVSRSDSYNDSPVVGPKTAAQLRQFLALPDVHPMPDRPQMEMMIGRLANATAQAKTSEAEAKERMAAYWLALHDIPLEDLRWAYAELVKTSTFLPTPAEIRTKAQHPGLMRAFHRTRARMLLTKHEREWSEPVEYVRPEELEQIKAEVAKALSTATIDRT